MIRLPRLVSAAAMCMIVCAPLAQPARVQAGFDLTIDASSFRFSNASSLYEIDILLSKNAIGTTQTQIMNVGFNLSFTPDIAGIAFVGLSNTATNRLFNTDTATTFQSAPASQSWFGAIQVPFTQPVPVPDNPSVVATLQMSYGGGVDGNSNIVFGFAGYGSPGDAFLSFTSTQGVSGLTFIAVPEPNVGLISAVVLGATAMRRRWVKRRKPHDAETK